MTKWIVAFNTPYYPSIREFDDVDEALTEYRKKVDNLRKGEVVFIAEVYRYAELTMVEPTYRILKHIKKEQGP